MINRLAGVAIVTAALIAAGSTVSAASPFGIAVLPRPDGQFSVGTTTLHLLDQNRPDPFRPDRARELMVSVFYPAADVDRSPRARYLSTQLMTDLDRQFGFQFPGVFTNSYTDADAVAGGNYPVVLYSPGAGVTRLMGTGLAEDLASRGYVVVTIDHTYETTPAVEFPGGRLVQAASMPDGITPEVRKKFIDARLRDTTLVLDSLARLAQGDNPDVEHRALPGGLGAVLDMNHIGMVGHSSGGYTAVESMHEDHRISAAVDLDGQIGVDEDFGRAVTEGEDRPVLVMTSQQIEEVGDANPSLDAFWQHSTGWKRQVTLRDSAHYDFTDMPLFIPPPARTAAARYAGPIAPERGARLIHTYVAAMFDRFLRGRTDTVLEQSPTEPELIVLR
ncbi:alpha/beta hydrolase family protein [Nocardia sp. NPDC057668]|uniref:alpha/beta hydrolase family protein n=1 Tax=Nocardia sp. NPDC057668 TaxID=3346202 RepID=UPI00367147D4